MSVIKKVTIFSIAAAALASAALKLIPMLFRRKNLFSMVKKGVSLYTKWKIGRFIERTILKRMRRREPLRGWRRILWYAR